MVNHAQRVGGGLTSAARAELMDALPRLVDSKKGTISSRIFQDPAIHALELEKLFGQSWLFVAHESLIPEPGNFFASRMGIDPVLVVRQRDGTIAVYLNQCRHRGARVCRADWGKTPSWTCPYHGWTYNLAGELAAIPKSDAIGGERIDKAEWGLIPVAKIHNYHGLIFATWNPQAPTFEDFLGPTAWYFDLIFQRPGGTEVVGGVQKWVVKANWKLAAEQFTSDIYHFDSTHLGTMMAMAPEGAPAGAPPPISGRQFRGGGHGGAASTDVAFLDMMTMQAMGPEVLHYTQSRRQEMAAYLGELRAFSTQIIHANIFPNLGVLPMNQTLRVWQPNGPAEMEVWAWTIMDKDAPQPVKDEIRRRTQFTFASSGVFEQDDAENWADAQRAFGGHVGGSTLLNNQIGLGEETDPAGTLPGTTDFATSEAASRAFYAHWRDLLLAD